MKALLLLISLFFVTTEAFGGLPPTTLRGQTQGTRTTTFNFEVPSNLATKTTAGTLIELDGMNQLENPSFSASTFSSSWTKVDTSGSASISAQTAYKLPTTAQSYRLNMTSWVGTVCGSILTGAPWPKQSVASMWVAVSGAHNGKVCSRVDGVIQTCAPLTSDLSNETFIEYVIPTVTTGSTAEVCFVQDVASNDVVWLGKASLGAMPSTMSPEVAQAQLAVSGYFAATTSASISRTSTTPGAFTTVAAFPAPTYLINDWGCATTDANKFAVTCANVPPGRVVFVADYVSFASTATNSRAAIFDGTTTGITQASVAGTTLIPNVVAGDFSYTSSGSRTFEVYVASGTGSITMSADDTGTGGGNPKFKIYYYPPASKIYSQATNEGAWVSCGLTTADFAGFGTVSSIQDQCMKQGSDLLMRVKFTSGTSTATEARVNLRLAGTALTSANSTIIPSIQAAGTYGRGLASTNQKGGLVHIAPSLTYVTMSDSFVFGSGSVNSLLAANGTTIAASGEAVSFIARIPINGWSQSQITGTFANVMTVPGISRPRTCTVQFGGASASTNCTTTPCTVYTNTCGGATVARASTGSYQTTFANGTFAASSIYQCTNTCIERTIPAMGQVSPLTSASGGLIHQTYSVSSTVVALDAYCTVECKGSAP